MVPIHISNLNDKSATAIANSRLLGDIYHQRIQTAAALLADWPGHWIYQTQYASGNTAWRDREGSTALVNAQTGEVTFYP